jgi:hypothetical protein
MRIANLMFEKKDNKLTFIRGRINEKENRWNDKMKVGKTTYIRGEVYEVQDVISLTDSGIRVVLEPPQPKAVKQVEDPRWRKISVEAVEKPAKDAEAKAEAPKA